MKKLMFMAAFAVIGLSNVNAQDYEPTYGFEEGGVLLEGSIGINSTKDKNTDTKTNSSFVNPKVGYFLTDDFVLGVEGAFGSDSSKRRGQQLTDNKAYSVGLFGRYYFLELGKRFKTYTELGAGYVSSKDKIADVKADGFGAGLSLGINYFVTENIAISFGLADVLAYSSAKVDGGEAVSEFNANLNVFNNFFENAQFGLTFKL